VLDHFPVSTIVAVKVAPLIKSGQEILTRRIRNNGIMLPEQGAEYVKPQIELILLTRIT
jgi:hypothetical protein